MALSEALPLVSLWKWSVNGGDTPFPQWPVIMGTKGLLPAVTTYPTKAPLFSLLCLPSGAWACLALPN